MYDFRIKDEVLEVYLDDSGNYASISNEQHEETKVEKKIQNLAYDDPNEESEMLDNNPSKKNKAKPFANMG